MATGRVFLTHVRFETPDKLQENDDDTENPMEQIDDDEEDDEVNTIKILEIKRNN